MASRFVERPSFRPREDTLELLPFQFERFDGGRVLLTNLVGEHLFVNGDELETIVDRRLDPGSELLQRLRSKQIVRVHGEEYPVELLALKATNAIRATAELHRTSHPGRVAPVRALLPLLPGLAPKHGSRQIRHVTRDRPESR